MQFDITTIGAFEAKTHLSSLLDQVKEGESFIITKHGKAIARLIPEIDASKHKVEKAIQRLKQLRIGSELGDVTWQELRDEGRT